MEELPSMEEQNELGRSVKRKKDARVTGEVLSEAMLEDFVPQSEDRVKRLPTSYKERLLGKISESFQDCFFSEDGVEEEGMDEDVDEEEDGTPKISLSKEDRDRIRSQWKSSIIVKLFGSEVSYGFLEPKLRILWKINGGWELISLGYGFFLVRFSCFDECAKVIRGGTWFIQGRFLAMRRWEPNFRASEASVSVVAVWIRLPELPIEYYDIGMLNRIGSVIGPVLRVDSATLSGQRGRFARLCVQLNLEKPLLKCIRIGRLIQAIQYEGVESLCFSCGFVGGHDIGCSKQKLDGVVEEIGEREAQGEKGEEKKKVNGKGEYGEWMIVQKKKRMGVWVGSVDQNKGSSLFKGKNERLGKAYQYEERMAKEFGRGVAWRGSKPVEGRPLAGVGEILKGKLEMNDNLSGKENVNTGTFVFKGASEFNVPVGGKTVRTPLQQISPITGDGLSKGFEYEVTKELGKGVKASTKKKVFHKDGMRSDSVRNGSEEDVGYWQGGRLGKVEEKKLQLRNVREEDNRQRHNHGDKVPGKMGEEEGELLERRVSIRRDPREEGSGSGQIWGDNVSAKKDSLCSRSGLKYVGGGDTRSLPNWVEREGLEGMSAVEEEGLEADSCWSEAQGEMLVDPGEVGEPPVSGGGGEGR